VLRDWKCSFARQMLMALRVTLSRQPAIRMRAQNSKSVLEFSNLEHRVDRASTSESVVDGPGSREGEHRAPAVRVPSKSPKKATGLGPGHVWKH
jgi:hypothetical protein